MFSEQGESGERLWIIQYIYLFSASQVLIVAGNAEIITGADIYEALTMLQIDINIVCVFSLNPHKNLKNTFNTAILQMRNLRHGEAK